MKNLNNPSLFFIKYCFKKYLKVKRIYQSQNEADLDLKLILKRAIERLIIKILMSYIAYFVQFNEFFQKITSQLIYDDFLACILGQNFNHKKVIKFF